MAPGLFEKFLLAPPQTASTWGLKPNQVAKFALCVAAGGLMLRSDGRRHRYHHLDTAFEVCFFANLILGLLVMYRSIVARAYSTTTGNGKLMAWVTLFISVVTIALSSYLMIFAN